MEKLNRMQVFLAGANAEIEAACDGIPAVGYLAHVIRVMQQMLRQELLPLLNHYADTVNAAREGTRGENIWIFRK